MESDACGRCDDEDETKKGEFFLGSIYVIINRPAVVFCKGGRKYQTSLVLIVGDVVEAGVRGMLHVS